MTRARGRALPFVLASLSGAGAAAPQSPAQVQLTVDACVAAPRSEIERLCALELGAQPLPPSVISSDATRLLVTCRERLILLQVDDPVTGKTTQRLINVGRLAPPGQARLLALALAELVTASWVELALSPKPQVPSAQALATPVARRAATLAVEQRGASRALRLAALVLCGGRFALREGRAPLWGGGLRLQATHPRHLGGALDLQYHRGADEATLGVVTTEQLSASAALFYHHAWGPGARRAGLQIGGGALGGAVRISGEPAPDSGAQSGTVWGATAGLYASGAAALTLGRLALQVVTEAGYTLRPVVGRAAAVEVAGISGPWLGLHLGIGITP